MSVLSSIRKKSGLLLGVIGLALFAFVAGDLFRSANGWFKGDPNVVGTVGDKEISRSEFSNLIQRYANQPNAKNQAWNSLVEDKALEGEYESLGINVSQDEFWDYFSLINGNNPNFDINAYKSNIAQIKSGNKNSQTYQQWLGTERSIIAGIKAKKYSELVSATSLVNSVEAKLEADLTADKVSFEMVSIPFSVIEKENKVEITDAEIKSYVQENEKDFAQKEARDIQFVVFDIEPKQVDKENTLKEVKAFLQPRIINDKINGITDTISAFGNVKQDSLYIAGLDLSAIKIYPEYFSIDQLPNEEVKTFTKTATAGEVYGPYQQKDSYLLTKYLGQKRVADSTQVAHILISFAGAERATVSRTKIEARTLVDSLMTQVNANASKYDEFVASFSEDQGSIATKGEYWITFSQKRFTPSFRKFALNNNVGTLKVVESPFGFHLMKLKAKKNLKTVYKLATIGKNAIASEETKNFYYKQANTFIQESTSSLQKFTDDARKIAKEVRVESNVDENKSVLRGLESTTTNQIVAWAFKEETEIGNAEKFDITNGYVIAYVSAKHEEGIQSVDLARGQVERVLKNEKLAQLATSKIADNKDLNSIAATFGQTIKNVDDLSFNANSIPELGNEPAIIGTAFGLETGKMSSPVVGRNGVYVLRLKSKVKGDGVDQKTITSKLKSIYTSALATARRVLVEVYDVNDHRNDFK